MKTTTAHIVTIKTPKAPIVAMKTTTAHMLL